MQLLRHLTDADQFRNPSKKVIGIDLLRILAASMVLLYHLTCMDWIPQRHSGLLLTHVFDQVQCLTCYGWIGVPLFFVISGFVIAYSAQRSTATTFVRHRIFRLWPLGTICSVICLLVIETSGSYVHQKPIFTAFASTLVFSPFSQLIDGAFWTLPIECCFYILVTWLLWRRSYESLPAVMAVLGLTSAVFWAVVLTNVSHPHHLMTRGLWLIAERNYTLIPYGCDFAIGVLTWELLYRRCTWLRLITLALISTGGMAQVWYSASTTQDFLHIHVSPGWSVTILLGGIIAIWLSALWNEDLHRRISALSARRLRRFGLMTYPIYLLNDRLGNRIMMITGPTIGYGWSLLLASIVLVSLSFFLANTLDPMIQLKLKASLSPVVERGSTA